MRSRPEHAEAVARRLAQLRAELGLPNQDPDAGPDLEAPGPPPGPSEPVPRLPEVGRHASRRVLPDTGRFSGSIRFGPWHITVLAVAVAAALALTCWLVVRSAPGEITVAPVSASRSASTDTGSLQPASSASLLTTPSGSPGGSSGGSSGVSSGGASPGAASGEVVVDVAGKVRRPGIAVLPVGSRVIDALKAAGGAKPGVELSGINLARVLVDGEQILVGISTPAVAGSTGASGSSGVGGSAGGSSGGGAVPVNLNTASLDELDAIPEVGPVTAQAIIDWRTENGGFTSVDELLEVDGIGPVTLEKISPHVTL